MSDRLQEMLRQRALVREHLAWLDREIAAAESVPPLPDSVDRPRQTAPTTTPSATGIASDAETILSQFKKEPSAVRTDARRGCLIAFSIAMALFVLATIVGYYFYGRHLGRWW